MKKVQWLGIVVLVVAETACGATSASTAATRITVASSARQQAPPCPETYAPRTFTASAPSDRNLAIVQLKGGDPNGLIQYTVRDITDILHPNTVVTFASSHPGYELASPQFVSAAAVSYIDYGQLVRMPLVGPTHEAITDCATDYRWSPDGSTVAYVSHPRCDPSQNDATDQLRLVSGGRNRVVDSIPTACFGFTDPVPDWDRRLLYSPNGAYVSLLTYDLGSAFRIWKSDGTLVVELDRAQHPTMSVWSGDTLYWRDEKGVETWRGGVQSLKLPGVRWIRPKASPSGGQIVYETRGASDTPYVFVMNTTTGSVQQLAMWRSSPVFLNSLLIWYQEERPCMPSDASGPRSRGACVYSPNTPSGKTYIYDLRDGTETESNFDYVFDVWPHPA